MADILSDLTGPKAKGLVPSELPIDATDARVGNIAPGEVIK